MLRLFIFGLIALPFHFLAIGMPVAGGNPGIYPWLNIMFTIIFSLIVLVLYDKIKTRALFWLLYVIIIVPVSFIFFEWSTIGVTMVLLFHIIRNETARRVVPPIFAGACQLLFGLLSLVGMQHIDPAAIGASTDILAFNPDFAIVMPTFAIGCVLAAILLKNYNGERGKRMKWLFYAFYPIHLAVLAAVALSLGLVSLGMFGL